MKGRQLTLIRESLKLSEMSFANESGIDIDDVSNATAHPEEDLDPVVEFWVWKYFMARFSSDWWGPATLETPAWLNNYSEQVTRIARTPIKGDGDVEYKIPPAPDGSLVRGDVDEYLWEKSQVEKIVMNYINLLYSRWQFIKFDGLTFEHTMDTHMLTKVQIQGRL